jgi:hypothetical protein
LAGNRQVASATSPSPLSLCTGQPRTGAQEAGASALTGQARRRSTRSPAARGANKLLAKLTGHLVEKRALLVIRRIEDLSDFSR